MPFQVSPIAQYAAAVPGNKSTLSSKVDAAKLVSRFSQEAKLGLALDSVVDYLKIVKVFGFEGQAAWAIAQRAFIASEAQLGKLPQMSWQNDAAWTKL